MWRIKCSNGKYIQKTGYGNWLEYTKNGKVFHSENILKKNFDLCESFVEKHKDARYDEFNKKHGCDRLTFKIEKLL